MKKPSNAPMKHQLKSLAHADAHKEVLDTSDTGTGKTAVPIWQFEKLRKRRGVGAMLVLCPRTLMHSAWELDAHKFAPGLKVVLCPAEKREGRFKEQADIYVTNHDAVKWMVKQKPWFWEKFKGGMLVIDESPAYKHHTSQRTKAAFKVRDHFEYVRLLTATPNSNTIVDVWSQAYILDYGKRLGNSFYKFRDAVCTPVQTVEHNPDAIKWVDMAGAEEAVFGLLHDVTIRHLRDDCVDLPKNTVYTMPYQLTKKQMEAYLELERSQILALEGGKKLTAVSASAVATKLLQVASGAVYSELGNYSVVDDARYEFVADLVAERPRSLVFFLWKHQKHGLEAEFKKRGYKYAVIDGEASDRDRNEAVQAYQAGLLDAILAHPASAAHGLTFTAGQSTIWTSPTYNLEHFVQGSMRQYRIGQKKKTETIVVVAEGTIEQEVYDKMLVKDARMKNLLELFASLVK